MNEEKLGEGFYKETINDETLTKANAILVIKCANLEQQAKKQQKINQKAIEYIKEKQKIQYKFALSQIECDELLKILEGKEVSE